MLTVTLVPDETCLFSASRYFDLNYLDEWFDDPVVKQMVLDIDKTVVVGPQLLQSPVLGAIPPSSLSGGVKGLILILKDPDQRNFSSTIFGSNCVLWLTKLTFVTDFTITMEHSLEFYDFLEPICAQTDHGKPLTIQREVWGYYVDNYPTSDH